MIYFLAVPSRDHVFLLTFPKEWRYNEINQLFAPYGKFELFY